jgi:hypothetical protein
MLEDSCPEYMFKVSTWHDNIYNRIQL